MGRARFVAVLALGAVAAGCAGAPDRQAAVPSPPDLAEPPPVRTKPGTTVRDINDDGFIDADEAAGYYARRFGELDQDGDALLSREEIARDLGEEHDARFEALDRDADRMINQDEYFLSSSDRYRQKVDPTSGMMSTSDFDSMIGRVDPAITSDEDPADL
jgi:hypothetical protein